MTKQEIINLIMSATRTVAVCCQGPSFYDCGGLIGGGSGVSSSAANRIAEALQNAGVLEIEEKQYEWGGGEDV